MQERFFITPYCLIDGKEVTTSIFMSTNKVGERPPTSWVSRQILKSHPLKPKVAVHILRSIEVSKGEYDAHLANPIQSTIL